MAAAAHAREPPPELSVLSGPLDGTAARCLVLGAGGFIGTNLCLALTARGLWTTGFGRSIAAPAALRDLAGFRWTQGDVSLLSDPDGLVRGHTHLFDLIGAGLPNSSNENPAQIVADGMPPRIRLLDACCRQGVRRIVFASSGGTVYGSAAGAIAETAPTDPISAYGIGKLTAEKYLALYRHLHGLDYRILRIGNAYGRFQHPHREQGLVAAVLHRLLHDDEVPIWGDGAAVRDYVHIDDVVAAMLLAAFAAVSGPRLFNVGSGVGRSVLDVVRDAARALDRPERIRWQPGRSADVSSNVLDSRLLRDSLGWRPRVDWNRGLAATAEWLRALPFA